MRKRICIFSIVIFVTMFALSGLLMAATITVTTANGTCSGTLTGANIDNNGNISINASSLSGNCVSTSTPPPDCTPTSASVSPSYISRTIVQGSTANSETVTVKDNCNNNLAYTASVTSGSSWISAPTSGNGTLNITFNTANLAPGSYSGTVRITPSTYSPVDVNVSLTVNQASGGGDCIDITAYKYPKYSPDLSIPAQSVVNYCFALDSNASTIQITMSSRDWWTSSHVFMSDVRNQTKDEILNIINTRSIFNTYPNPAPWYNIAAGSNERVYVYKYPGKAGQKFYVTVYNAEPSASSLIQLYWIAY